MYVQGAHYLRKRSLQLGGILELERFPSLLSMTEYCRYLT